MGEKLEITSKVYLSLLIPEWVRRCCNYLQKTTQMPQPMRNILLRGGAGTGKTSGARAIAAGLGLPYFYYTCSAGTEIFDLIGSVFPETSGDTACSSEVERQREWCAANGGLTYDNIAKLLQLPDMRCVDFDPPSAYKELTGEDKPDANSRDCMKVICEQIAQKTAELSGNNLSGQPRFRYIETDLLKALKHGYLVEIQEPSCIAQPGVLVGLNALLEQNGMITLPTGEVIRRHPDAVVILTTNVTYEGCREINQSFLDRMNLTLDIGTPTENEMVERAIKATGCEEADRSTIAKMVQTMRKLEEFMREHNYSGGTAGMRSLLDWILAWKVTGDLYSAVKDTVIPKAAVDPDEQEELMDSIINPVFAPF